MVSNLFKKVFTVGATAVVILALVGSWAGWEFSRVLASQSAMGEVSTCLRNQTEADMMHDALRGDVLVALRASHSSDTNALAEVAKDLAEHAATLRSKMAANQVMSFSREVS